MIHRITSTALHAALTIICLSVSVIAQTDDFNDGSDNGWSRFTPLEAAGGTVFSFPAGGYRISCAPSPDPGTFGPARAGSFQDDVVYSTFCLAVDIVDWDPAEDTSMGLLARVQPNPAAGALGCYAFTYQGNDRDLEINVVTGEFPTRISIEGSLDLSLDETRDYRMVFFGIGDYLEGRVYDLADLVTPLAVITAFDSTYTQGFSGLVVFADENTTTAATYDNFSADAGRAPELTMRRSAPGGIDLTWDPAKALCHRLEMSTNMQQWSGAPPAVLDGGNAVISLTPVQVSSVPRQFFRFTMGPLVLAE